MKKGCLRGLPLASTAVGETCHSYHPSAGTRQRRERAALAKAPLPSTDSARAFVMRRPVETSLDHGGTRPHVSIRSWRAGTTGSSGSSPRGRRVRTTGACLDGAMFQSGSPAGGLWGFLSTLRAGSSVWSSSTSKASMSSSGRALAAYLPHMRHSVCRVADDMDRDGIPVRHDRDDPEGRRGRHVLRPGYVDTVGAHRSTMVTTRSNGSRPEEENA